MNQKDQRIIIGMFGGFGLDYLQKSPMPNLDDTIRSGFFTPVKGIFPSMTNSLLSSIS